MDAGIVMMEVILLKTKMILRAHVLVVVMDAKDAQIQLNAYHLDAMPINTIIETP